MTQRVLIVDDEKDLADGLKYNIEIEGYDVDAVYSGEAAMERIHGEGEISLLLLDIMMPGLSGLDVLERIRNEDNQTPVILLTAKSQPEDKVKGLELGADDYVTKPFGLPELLARIRAVLRRAEPDESSPAETIYEFEGLTVDFKRYVVARGGKEYRLSRFESEILRYLLDHKDAVVTRRDLLTKVWGYTNLPTTRTVDNHIARLRKKVEVVAEEPTFILTIHGIGYRFETGLTSK